MVLVHAPLFNMIPNVIGSTSIASDCSTVSSIQSDPFGKCFMHSASATDGYATPERLSIDRFFRPTGTETRPKQYSVLSAIRAKNCQSSKCFGNYIDDSLD
jgi:hypothetical protein